MTVWVGMVEPEVFPPDLVCVNLPALRLQVWRDGILKAVFPMAIGKPGDETPVGEYSIAFRRRHPTWYPPEGGQPVPPGPRNPLGSRFLGLNLPSYGIHGTNQPGSIGHPVSRGCIRLGEADVHRFWDLTYEGIRVRIVYERLSLRSEWWGKALLVFPDVYGRQPLSAGGLALTWPEAAREPSLVQEALDRAEKGPALLVLGDSPRRPEGPRVGSGTGGATHPGIGGAIPSGSGGASPRGDADGGRPRYCPLRYYPFPSVSWSGSKGLGLEASK